MTHTQNEYKKRSKKGKHFFPNDQISIVAPGAAIAINNRMCKTIVSSPGATCRNGRTSDFIFPKLIASFEWYFIRMLKTVLNVLRWSSAAGDGENGQDQFHLIFFLSFNSNCLLFSQSIVNTTQFKNQLKRSPETRPRPGNEHPPPTIARLTMVEWTRADTGVRWRVHTTFSRLDSNDDDFWRTFNNNGVKPKRLIAAYVCVVYAHDWWLETWCNRTRRIDFQVAKRRGADLLPRIIRDSVVCVVWFQKLFFSIFFCCFVLALAV